MSLLSKTLPLSLVCCSVFVLALSGCSERRPAGLPKLYPVTLQFTQGGEPCVEAAISLIPESDSPWGTGGITDADGKVTLYTHGKYLGIPAGNYKITVSKTEIELIGPAPVGMGDVQASHAYNLIDSIYSLPSTTTLSIEVGEGTRSFPPFELGEKVREFAQPPGT